MRYALNAAQRRGKSFHSKRVWVACGMRACDRSDGEIQAWVRWSSVESLLVYARRSHDEQARARDALQHADVDTINSTTMPKYDETDEDIQVISDLADGLAAGA